MTNTDRDIDQLIADRKTLTTQLAACTPGAFPGSAAWKKENKCILALAAFDKANPEVLPEIRNRKRQARS